MSTSVLERLQVNVASIVIGALLFIIIKVWTETIALIVDAVSKEETIWNDKVKKHLISSSIITFFSVCIMILLYIRTFNQIHA